MNNEYFIMYTQNGCKWCDKAKELLNSKGFEWEEINISANAIAKAEFIKEGFTKVPQIFDYKNELIGGYTELEKYFDKNN